jgi:hypothetical protein
MVNMGDNAEITNMIGHCVRKYNREFKHEGHTLALAGSAREGHKEFKRKPVVE